MIMHTPIGNALIDAILAEGNEASCLIRHTISTSLILDPLCCVFLLLLLPLIWTPDDAADDISL